MSQTASAGVMSEARGAVDAAANALGTVLRKQEDLVAKLKADYLQAEMAVFAHTEGSDYDSLDQGQKGVYTRKLNELTKTRDELVKKVDDAVSRLKTTKSLVALEGGSAIEETRSRSVRIPPLPSFRGENKDSIKDAHEFLGKIKALFEAHLVPENRWYSALLTTMTNIDRQWASANLAGLEWNELERAFLNHYESPALRNKLIRDLMTISMNSKESVQEYSDRFTSLMNRTGRSDNDESLVAVYIDGLDTKLQELMNISTASAINTWRLTNEGSPPVSITQQISNAITYDAARKSKSKQPTADGSKTDDDMSSTHSSAQRKRCAKCKSKRHTTEEHRSKPSRQDSTASNAQPPKADPSKEKRCFKCTNPGKQDTSATRLSPRATTFKS